MSTTEIGALIVSMRSESAQFRAEMDKARDKIKDVGGHAALSSRSIAQMGAILAERTTPALQGHRLALEALINKMVIGQGLFRDLGLAAAGFAAALGGFALGNMIRNFIDLRNAGFGYVEALKLAIGETKSYLDTVKDATKEQKEFSKAMADQRNVTLGLQKELASLTDNQRKLVEISATQRRERIQTLPLEQRAAAQQVADMIEAIELSNVRLKQEDAILESIQKQRDERQKEKETAQTAAEGLGLGPTSLIQGTKDIDEFVKKIEAIGLELRNLAQEGQPATALFNEIALTQGKVDDTIDQMKVKFQDVPALFNRVVEIQNQIGGGGFRKQMDQVVDSIQKLGGGIGPVGIDMQGLADTMQENIPTAAAAASASLVIVTGNVEDLARAVANARVELALFTGAQAIAATAGVATAPGNFE